jgi:hypothetical protein
LCLRRFFENCAAYEIMSKNMVEPEGLQTGYNIARTSCMLDKQGYTHARASTRPRSRASTNTRARTHTHTHTQICNTVFPRQQWLRESASILRYTHIACLVTFYIRVRTENVALYSIQRFVFITEIGSVYCAVRNGSLNKTDYVWSFKG